MLDLFCEYINIDMFCMFVVGDRIDIDIVFGKVGKVGFIVFVFIGVIDFE